MSLQPIASPADLSRALTGTASKLASFPEKDQEIQQELTFLQERLDFLLFQGKDIHLTELIDCQIELDKVNSAFKRTIGERRRISEEEKQWQEAFKLFQEQLEWLILIKKDHALVDKEDIDLLYPNLHLHHLPPDKADQIHLAIARALVYQMRAFEIKQVKKENTPEAQALAFLGCDIAAYNRRMQPIAIHAIEDAATALLQQEEHLTRTPFDILKQEISDSLQQARKKAANQKQEMETSMRIVGLKNGEIAHIHMLAHQIVQIGKEFTDMGNKMKNELVNALGIRNTSFKNILFGYKDAQIKDMTTTTLQGLINDSIRSEFSLSPKGFESFFKNRIDKIITQEVKESFARGVRGNNPRFEKARDWFKKYEPYFVVEFQQQGEAARFRGVCLGKVHRHARNTVNEPDCDETDHAMDRILPADRLYQSKHADIVAALKSLSTVSQLPHFLLPESLLEKQGLEEVIAFTATHNNQGLIQALANDKIRNQLILSNGGLKLYLRNHALFARCDTNRNRHSLMDPNIGTLKFPAAEMIATCYEELCAWAYPDSLDTPTIGIQLLDRNKSRNHGLYRQTYGWRESPSVHHFQ